MGHPDIVLGTSAPAGTFRSEEILSSVIATKNVPTKETLRPFRVKAKPNRPLHRLAAVRREQNLSLTRIARRLGVDIAEARCEEQESTDMLLSRLYDWQAALQVPVSELIVEADGIPSNPIKSRCQLLKMMKTIRSLLENAKEESVLILVRQLMEELLEIMPELKSISAWPSIGQSREQREPGQAALRRFDVSISRRIESGDY